MNRNIYRLVRSQTGLWVPAPEYTSSNGKGGRARKALVATAAAISIFSANSFAADYQGLPNLCSVCGGAKAFVEYGLAQYGVTGNVGTISQVGDKAILNWQNFNIAPGNQVVFQRVADLLNLKAIDGASFSTLNRIWDQNPSVIAGQISTVANQKANLMFINQNGIVFANGAQVNVNQLTASALNISNDAFINNTYAPTTLNTTPSFRYGMDGVTDNFGGFVKVLEGAKITSDVGGRVMLIAPTVTNRGEISTPNGQAILAAGSKVYLQTSSVPSLRGLLVQVDNANLGDGQNDVANTTIPSAYVDSNDKLGNATNIGSLTASKGNITMVGMAVNQMGRATATSAYNYNGSIYLRAISDPVTVGENFVSSRSGRVVLGSGSLTDVGIDTSDITKSTVNITPSKVDVVGKDIQVKSNAQIVVPAGVVNFSALEDPSKLLELNPNATDDPFVTAVNGTTTKSSILFESGSLVDVSGLNAIDTQDSNVLAITLYGAELANSPINRQTLRGKTVYVDVNKGSPLIANLSEYQANIAKTLQQRSTAAGSVRVQSTGQSIVQPNATFNLSGGTTTYEGKAVATTSLIGADGKTYDISQATPDTQFVGLANEFTQNEGWGQTGIFSRVQTTYSPGYVQGGDAGLLLLNARSAYLNGNILGGTTAGINQLQTGQLPLSATFMLGFNKGAEFGVNQNVLIDGKIGSLSADNTLTDDQANNLHLASAMFGQGKIGRLEINTNKNVTIDQTLKMADGGSVNINAAKVNVNADIITTKANVALNQPTIVNGKITKPLPVIASTYSDPKASTPDAMNADVQTKSGAINITATDNLSNNATDTTVGTVLNKPEVIIADGVKLSSTGFWVNEQADLFSANQIARLVDGGSISLKAAYYDTNNNLIDSSVQLGVGSMLDVRGGAYRSFAGKTSYGKGGDILLYATDVVSGDALENHFKAESFGVAGNLSVTSDHVLIGAKSATGLSVDGGFFNQGFASYSLTGLSGLQVAENANIKVQTNNLILSQSAASAGNASSADSVGAIVLLDDSLRKSADLSLSATSRGKDASATTSVLSDLNIGKNAQIITDIGANVKVLATNSVDINGSISAPAGNISVTLHNGQGLINNTQRIHLGENAVLSATGAAKLTKDVYGLNQGVVLSGGVVSLHADDGYVDTEKNALIDVHGASPVELNIANANGGQGQILASDAGAVDIQGFNGLYLDNNFSANAGSSVNRGGSINVGLGSTDGSTNPELVMHIGTFDTVSPANNEFRADSQLKQGYIDPTKLQSKGFDTVKLSSRDTIEFDQGGNFGASKPLYSVQLNASNITSTVSGNSKINAKLVALGNTDLTRQSAAGAPTTGNTKLDVNADYIALNGNTSYSGFSDVNLNSTGEVRLIGVQPLADIHGSGALNTLANVNIAANLVDPSSLTTFDINTNGVGDVRFSFVPRVSDILSYSAQGVLKVEAKNIVQAGRIVAPFGGVTLKADDGLTLESGSVTSVAAADGQLIPFGYTLNGTTWFFDKSSDGIANANTGDNEVVSSLNGKTVSLTGNQVNIKSGATLDISAAGDLQASQFTAGPGGTTDFLAQNGYYAILPAYNGTVAPTDVLRDSTSNQPLVGSSVYLSASKGLAAGKYVLLPAKYALLPGAFAIKVTNGVSDVLPNNNYVKSDGVAVVSGFLSDQRFSSSDVNTARWTGFELMTKSQVLDRADYALTNASVFFTNNTNSAHIQDAGLLQIGVAQALSINGSLKTSAASGGVGAGLDISADKLAVLSASAASSAQAGEVVLDVDQLNALNIDSLLLGATRTRVGSTSTLDVKAKQVRIDNVAGAGEAALQGREIMLAAKNDVLLQRSATIKATGNKGDAGTYIVSGDAAFVRAAATDVELMHKDTTRATGNVYGDASVSILASESIMLDASNNNIFLGKLNNSGFNLPNNLLISANRINVGAIPTGIDGLSLTDGFLNALTDVQNLTLRSYSTFDFYGNAQLGSSQVSSDTGMRNYSVNNLSLEAAAIRGFGDVADVAHIQAQTLTFANPNSVTNSDLGSGTGQLNTQSEKMYLGAGDKAINGFSNINITSTELMSQDKKGTLSLAANTQINTARMTGNSASDQTIVNTADINISTLATTLNPLNTVGNSWAVSAKRLNVDTAIQAVSGDISLTATEGDLTLGQNAILNASGKLYQFNDASAAVDAGSITLKSAANISAISGAQVNLDAAAGGNAGLLNVQAVNGQADMSNVALSGKNIVGTNGLGKSGSVAIDAKSIANFDQLNQQLNQAGFAEKRDFHLRSGDLKLTQTGTGTIQVHELNIAVDGGALSVGNMINASGAAGGNITLYARDDVNLTSSANLNATATASGQAGGNVTLGTQIGNLALQGGVINVAGGQGQDSGAVYLRTPRTNTNVNVSSLNTAIQGAKSVSIEGVKTYNNITTLNAATTSNGNQLSVNTILADNKSFMDNKANILSTLGSQATALGSKLHLLGGAEVRSSGDMTVASDLNFYQANRPGGESGVLTLRASGDLNVKGSISDGFTTVATTGVIDPNKQSSWSYRLVSGADQSAANPLGLAQPSLDIDGSKKGDFTLATGKLIRTGTGSIDIAATGDFNLGSQTSVIYTAGRLADSVQGFDYLNAITRSNGAPVTANNFTQDGGNITLNVMGDVIGAPTDQLYSSWLYRQGNVNTDGNFDATHPQTAWWIQFSQFQQGIATLGGGDVSVNAGGNVNNLSVSAATNGRMAAATPTSGGLVMLGGGDVNITAIGNIVAGEYYAGKGKLNIDTKGGLVGTTKNGDNLYTTIALGDAQANIKAKDDINIEAVINPTMVVQSSTSAQSGANAISGNVFSSGGSDYKQSTFSTYTDNTAIAYESLNGNVELHNYVGDTSKGLIAAYHASNINWTGASNYDSSVLYTAPGGLKAYAYNGDITLDNRMSLYPSNLGAFELLAKDNVNIIGSIVESDAPLNVLSDARSIVSKFGSQQINLVLSGDVTHANSPVHMDDSSPALIYALDGNVQGSDSSTSNVSFAKSAKVIAGNDYKNLGLTAQNLSEGDVTSIKAGRDIVFDSNITQRANGFTLGGAGLFEFEAGRGMDLGSTLGISTVGNIANNILPSIGADINVAVGVPNGVDYEGAINRLLSALSIANAAGVTVDDNTLWQVRWLTGNRTLVNNATTLLSAVDAIKTQGDASIRQHVRDMFYTSLRETGRDYNNADSPYAGQYSRGYSTIQLLFPYISEKNADGTSKYYAGNLSLPLTTIKTKSGGNVEFMVPGGQALVGYTNISDDVLSAYQVDPTNPRNTTTTGIVAVGAGSIKGFTLGDILVNQSRILTVAGGDILLWSSEGNIDAGKGKRTAVVVPPPLITTDTNGNIVVTLQGAATGSGIGALGDANSAGSVDLIAPKGTVDAGDAGIRAKNINIAAQVVLNAGNITASGNATGTQVAVAGALNGALTGASGAGDPSKAINDAVKSSIQPTQEPFSKPPSPSFINVEVVSIGD